jgi:hypothetical protein
MSTSNGAVCAQCNISMMLERIEPDPRRDRVRIEVYRCEQCQLVETITRIESQRRDRSRRAAVNARAWRQLRV